MNEVPRTDDGRYIVVNGRRWRATDPNIPEALRIELVAELMSARRDVRSDPASARPRVQDAKVALGERGEPWWDEPSDAGAQARLAAAIRTLLRHRDADSSICPSDVARIAGGTHWRRLMTTARQVAGDLRRDGVVRVTQRDAEVDPAVAKGPIRIRRGPRF